MNVYQSNFDRDFLQEEAFYEALELHKDQEEFESETEELLAWATHLAKARFPSKVAVEKIRHHLGKIAAMV